MKSQPSLASILSFVNLLNKFRLIERKLLVQGTERQENDVDHSFSLAMLGWYINSTYSLNLDTDKIFKYALAHDLVEIYAGDTFFYQTDQHMIDDKQQREEKALYILKDEFPEFSELCEIIEQYEKREDQESKFIYALDKIEPVMSIYQDKGRTWKRDGVTLEMLTSMKLPKVALDPVIETIFKELVQKMEEHHDELFNRQ